MDEARASFEEALAIHREVVDPRHEGIRLGQLARHVLLTTGDWREATELAREGDRRLEGTYDIDRGTTLGPLGHALLASGRSAAGTLALVETIARAVSDGGASNLDAAMGMLARAQRDFDAGVPLVGGHAAGDVTPGQRRWLAEHRPGAIAGA
jgi:hypothetical protein